MKFGRRGRRAPDVPAADPADPQRLLNLLFPAGLRPADRERLLTVVRSSDTWSPSLVRRLLAAVDRQTNPSPFAVRLGPDDVCYVTVRGCELALDLHDESVSSNVIASGSYEAHVERLLADTLHPGAVFVDIGANVGYHTVVARTLVGAIGHVVAIDANTDNARLLANTIERNGFENVDLYPLAVSDRAGWVGFRSAIGSNGGFTDDGQRAGLDPSVTIVPTIPFDDLLCDLLEHLGRLDVIKVDVEGAEPLALRGARRSIERWRPTLVLEFSCEMVARVGGTAPAALLTEIQSWGYELAIIDRHTPTEHPIANVDDLMSTWGDLGRIEDLIARPTRRSV